MAGQSLTIYEHSDEYHALIDECQAILTEGIWSERLERILTFGRLGERIAEDSIYKKYGKGNAEFIETMSRDIGVSSSELYRAVQFYEKFKIVSPSSESWDKFKEGKNISWGKIKRNYLPTEEKRECEHVWEEVKAWRCRKCKKLVREKPSNELPIDKN